MGHWTPTGVEPNDYDDDDDDMYMYSLRPMYGAVALCSGLRMPTKRWIIPAILNSPLLPVYEDPC